MIKLDPWSSTQFQDYSRLRELFGIDPFDTEGVDDPHPLMRRNVIFAQRSFGPVKRAMRGKEPFIVMTGLVPSGRMHFGHKMVIDQLIYYQRKGGSLYVAVADLEGMGARNMSLKEGERIAREEYIANYLALGLSPERCQIYFQSKRQAVKDLMYAFASRVNWSELKAIYDFEGSTNIAHVVAPLVQAADILHPQLPTYEGCLPTLVPVGVDQDPHIRLTRDIASRFRTYNVTMTDKGVSVFIQGKEDPAKPLNRAYSLLSPKYGKGVMKVRYRALYLPEAEEKDMENIEALLARAEQKAGGWGFLLPGATYHRFQTGLDGGKMSSSKPESAVFLTDSDEVITKKISSAITGGAVSSEEQRKNGGDPTSCSVYEMYLYHLVESDKELSEIYEKCRGGEMLCGECKRMCTEKILSFMEELRGKREEISKDDIDAVIAE